MSVRSLRHPHYRHSLSFDHSFNLTPS